MPRGPYPTEVGDVGFLREIRDPLRGSSRRHGSWRFDSDADSPPIHRMQIEEFGGMEGVRDLGLLESALAQPHATFGGGFLHDDLFAMAGCLPVPHRKELPLPLRIARISKAWRRE